MNKFTTRAFSTLITSTALFWTFQSQAANSTYTWVGTTNDLTLNTNWSPAAAPISGDIGIFNIDNYTPEVSSGNTFTIDLVKFTGGAPYVFSIKDPGTSLSFVGSGVGPVYGVQNNSVNAQTFNVFNQGQLNFQNASSADSSFSTNVGNITYTVGNTTTSGSLTFKDFSSAGDANIVVNNGLVQFEDSSNADDANISLVSTNSSLLFSDNAIASNASVNAKNGNVITFTQFTKAEDATFNLGDIVSSTNAIINFKDESDAGAAIINMSAGSEVNFTDSSSFGIVEFNTTSADVINLNQTIDTGFFGTLTGTGTLNKLGTNKLNYLSDNSTFNGNTNVNAGNFALNSNLGGNVFVNAGGKLTGTGTILGNLYTAKDGVVAPGNSIGVLNVVGNYTQAANSTLLVQVDDQGNASKLAVVGQVSINQGTTALVTSDFIQLPRNQEFTAPILSSETGLSGTFSNVISANPLIGVNASYDADVVYLTWKNSFSGMGSSANQRRIADQLQGLQNPSDNNLAILSALALDSPKHQQRALHQLTAQPYANLLVNAEVTNHKFIRRLYNPVRLLVTSHPCCAPDNCSPSGCLADTWFDAGWDRSNFRGNRNAKGFSTKGFEVSLGSQMTIDSCWTVGVAGCYERDHLHYKVGGKGISNTYLGGLYTLFRPSDFYILSNFVGGYTQTKLKRHVDFGTFHFSNRGKPDIYQGTIYVEAGQDFGLDCFLFQPFVGIEAGYFRHDHIHEKGGNLFAVNVKNKTYGTASSRVGIHFLTELSYFKLFFDGAWQYRLSSLHNSSKQHFQNFGKDFTIAGIPFARSSFDSALNLSATIVDGLEVYVEGQGQWWKDASTFTALAGFIIAW
ncbi:MAG: autotransporter domain-containing protein [Parachlamydiaceae bacterium]|nr:autotransporter domain-containing protein [Parachlamydiaceae bacterium]